MVAFSIWRAFRKPQSIHVFSYFPFGFEGRVWDLNVSDHDHCLYFYFVIEDHILDWHLCQV